MLGHGEAIPEALMCIWDGCSCTCQWTTLVVADWFSVSGDEKVSLLFQQIIVHGRLEICLFLKILPISYRRGFSSGPCESGEKRVRMCSCLSGSSWNLQLLRNGSKTSFQLVLITILLRAALCSLDIYQLVNGLMLFYSEKEYTTCLIHTTFFCAPSTQHLQTFILRSMGISPKDIRHADCSRRVEPPAYRLVGDLLYYPNYCHS